MPRGKSPEETINRILDTSLQLFLEKGYEHTSIQDILDALGDLSKGAIYHHFKSKEDILLAVINKLFESHDAEWLEIVRSDRELTGLEKLKMMFRASVNSPRQLDIAATAPDFLKNPTILAMQIRSIMEESAPQFIRPIIEEGIADGSIVTAYPEQLAEVILLLINLWLTPLVYYDDIKVMHQRYELFMQMMRGLGLDLADDELLNRLETFWLLYGERRS